MRRSVLAVVIGPWFDLVRLSETEPSALAVPQAEKATLAKQAGGTVDGKKAEKEEYAQARPTR